MSAVMIADVIVILVPYTFRLLDYVTDGNDDSNDDSKRKCARYGKGKVYDFGFGCLWLHGVLYQFVNR
jgi:hypothetical protein